MPPWRSGGARSNASAVERSGPNGAIARSIPTTAWSLGGSKPNGSRACDLAQAEAELARHEQQGRCIVPPVDCRTLGALGADLRRVWAAPTTSDRDRKGLLRSLPEEVVIAVDRAKFRADLTLRWRGSAITESHGRSAALQSPNGADR